MILSAGLATRLRPLTDTLPKALVPVAGKPLIDHTLDALPALGVNTAVVNVHHRADQLEAHLNARPNGPAIRISDERSTLMDTGGGLAQALPLLCEDPALPILSFNGKCLWTDGPVPAVHRLAHMWDPTRMDALLLLAHTQAAIGYDGAGDFELLSDLRLAKPVQGSAPFVFTGIQLINPRLFEHAPTEPFSMRVLWMRAQAAGRLFGLVHDGDWMQVWNQASLVHIEDVMAARA